MREQFKLMELKNRLKETDVIHPSFSSLEKQYKEQIAVVRNLKHRMDREVAHNIDVLESLRDDNF